MKQYATLILIQDALASQNLKLEDNVLQLVVEFVSWPGYRVMYEAGGEVHVDNKAKKDVQERLVTESGRVDTYIETEEEFKFVRGLIDANTVTEMSMYNKIPLSRIVNDADYEDLSDQYKQLALSVFEEIDIIVRLLTQSKLVENVKPNQYKSIIREFLENELIHE